MTLPIGFPRFTPQERYRPLIQSLLKKQDHDRHDHSNENEYKNALVLAKVNPDLVIGRSTMTCDPFLKPFHVEFVQEASLIELKDFDVDFLFLALGH